MMDQALWVPGTKTPTGPLVHVWDRCFQHSLVVDVAGERYMDEAGPYMEVGQPMLPRHASLGTGPPWLIPQSRHRGRDRVGMPPPMPKHPGRIARGKPHRPGADGTQTRRT